METLTRAIERLEENGFDGAFRAVPGGDLVAGDRRFEPEELVVEEVVRFEGQSDPEDQAVLFALATRDGLVRGTFVATYGPSAEPETAAAMHRLEATPEKRRHHAGDV